MSLKKENIFPIKIKSAALSIDIAQPGSVYSGTRFDWTGFITQVTLTTPKGSQHTFCVPESLEPGKGTGGWGLCNEFGNDKVIGYSDAQPGELFPKLGIGLLKRPELPLYNFMHPHELQHPFTININTTEDQAKFIVDPIECRGYAVRYIKTITARENWLEIAYKLENVGSKLIDTNEYRHNFMAIDKHTIGTEYRLHFPYTIQLEDIARAYRQFLPPVLRKMMPGFIQDKLLRRVAAPGNKYVQIKGNDFLFLSTPQAPFYFRPLGFSKTDGYQWELNHMPSGIQMREYDDFTPSRVAVWGTTHVISAEIFVDINLEPGQEKTWSRKYEFNAPNVPSGSV
jgi:hypothetical protein